MSQEKPRIRWFTPDKPENISVGRQRIACYLRKAGLSIDVTGTTIKTIHEALCERNKYDVILGTTRAGAIAGTALGQITGKPVIVDHIDPIRQFQETHPRPLAVPIRLAENVSFKLADIVFYVYEEECARISRYADQVVKTDLGVDYKRFAEPDPEVVDRADKHLDNLSIREKVAIYVGGLEPIYHIPEMLDAIKKLSEWSLIIIGDGSLQEVVIEATKEQENIYYIGSVPHMEIPGYLQTADIGLSLVDDPHTLKVLEYGAAGLSVVQAEGQAKEKYGDLVEYCDPTEEEIRDAIERANDRENDHGLKEFAADFDWAEIAKDYYRAIDSVSTMECISMDISEDYSSQTNY